MASELFKVLKPAAGHISLFLLGTTLGGLTFSGNFSVQLGDLKFSTQNNKQSLVRLEQEYSTRVMQLKAQAEKDLRDYESNETTAEGKQHVLHRVIDHYLSPISHDKLFGHDMVLYNGKGKPTIMKREDFDSISDNWKRVLVLANKKDCVDNYKIGSDHEPAARQAIRQCCDLK